MQTRNQPAEIRSLTALRGVAALLVAWGHFHLEFPAPSRITLFVDLFFILSGYVIMLAYQHRVSNLRDHFRFLWLRLGRIYPAHLFTLLLAVLAIGYVNAMNGNPLFFWRDTKVGLVQNLALIQAWPPIGSYSWNMPAWSISAEWAAYLAFPVFLVGSKKLRDFFIVPVIAAWIWFYLERGGAGFGPGWEFGVHRALLGFPIGVWLQQLRPPRSTYSDSVGFLAIGMIGCVWILGLSDWFIVVPMALLILNLSGNVGILSRLGSWKPLHGLGLISYSLYLVHYPVYRMWQAFHARRFPEGMNGVETIVTAAVLTAVVLGLAYASWKLVEEPARKASKKVPWVTGTAKAKRAALAET